MDSARMQQAAALLQALRPPNTLVALGVLTGLSPGRLRQLAGGGAALVVAGVSVALWRRAQRRSRRRAADEEEEAAQRRLRDAALEHSAAGGKKGGGAGPNKTSQGGVDREFLDRLWPLLKIVLPGMRSKEAGLLFLHTGFLALRSFLSLYVARLDGAIVKAIVDRNARAFVFRLLRWLLVAVPAVATNSALRYLESKLALAFRTRLVDHVYASYMRNETYYRVGNVDGRMQNPDQCLTEDVARFTRQLAHLYSQVSKPLFDLVLMSSQLFALGRARARAGGRTSGMELHYPWMLGTGVFAFTFAVLRRFTPPFGRMAAEEARRDGHLRAVHARLITHAEEVAFYGGHAVEEVSLRRAYRSLVSQMNLIYKTRIPYTMLEQFLMKYVWSASGLTMIAIPALMQAHSDATATAAAAAPSAGGEPVSLLHDADMEPEVALKAAVSSVSARTQDFVTAKGLMISVADALERLMSSWKEVAELAGYTWRVSEMMTVFADVQRGHYVRGAIGEAAARALDGQGEVVEGTDFVRLENVPVVTPSGDVLVESLSFAIEPGQHLLITGPNGCGKSSLFRMLGGLWAVRGGRLYRPGRGQMFYIPQRPYLPEGTLRDQVIYPHTEAEMRAAGATDNDLLEIMDIVDLAYVVQREGGWDAVNDWRDVLSGGEKQRVGMARLFYHRPRYAILDECTSAVSIDVEGLCYLHAQRLGITLLTVTHRPSLYKYHSVLLQFDGHGGYRFSELNASMLVSLEEERSKLAKTLADVPRLQQRYDELCGMLGHER